MIAEPQSLVMASAAATLTKRLPDDPVVIVMPHYEAPEAFPALSGDRCPEDTKSAEKTDVVEKRVETSRELKKAAMPVATVVVAVVLLVIIMVVVMAHCRDQVIRLCQWLKDHSPMSIFYFFWLIVVWILVCVPSTPIEMACGFVFGFGYAVLLLLVAKQFACCLALYIGRKLSRGRALQETLMSGRCHSDTARGFFAAVEHHPWQVTLLIRLSYMPMAIKNYGMALLPCPFHVYFICVFVANVPYSILFADIGSTSKDLVDAMYSKEAHKVPAVEITLLVVGICFIVVVVMVLRYYTTKYAKMFHNMTLTVPLTPNGADPHLQSQYVTLCDNMDATISTSTSSPTTDYGSTSRTSSIESTAMAGDA